MKAMLAPVLVLAAALAGCTSFHAVETTPEGILRAVEPGDVVRLGTRDRGTLSLLVWSVGDEDIRGRTRVERGERSEVVRVRFDRIETLEIERLSLKKTMLTTLVPVVVGAAIVCSRQDCRTDGVVVSRP